MNGFKLPGVAWSVLLAVAIPVIAGFITDNWSGDKVAMMIVGVLLSFLKIMQEYQRQVSLPALPAGAVGEAAPRRKMNLSRVVWG